MVLLVAAAACTEDISPPRATGPRTIAFLFDGSPLDAELVTAPALAGLELAAHEAGGIEIEPVNLGLERDQVMAALRALGDDRGVIAAVVTPWTAPPKGAIELLAERGLPVVTLSWAWGPPLEGDGLWLSFAAGRAGEAVIVLSGATRSASEGARICLGGDDHVTSRALLETAAELGEAAGDPEIVPVGIAAGGRAATAAAVAARIVDSRCPVLVWTGGAPAAARVLSAIPDPPSVVGTSRIKTDDGLALADIGTQMLTVCACADVSLSLEPALQAFVHDLQAESGAPPGPFALEAYDAARMLVGSLGPAGVGRAELVIRLASVERYQGLAHGYRFAPDGSLLPGSISWGSWRASGSRWLPAPIVAG